VFERVLLAAALLLTTAVARPEEQPLRDPTTPFRPAATSAAAGAGAPRFELTAVLISESRKVAVVNGRPYREGGRVSGAVLVRIEPNVVHLTDGNDSFAIRLASARAPAQSSAGDSGQ